MQTALIDRIKNSHQGQEADRILRACVHCGFCTATCPTYQLLGDELDGPRGRIYQIKQVLEGEIPSRRLQQHLDRCLTCRACETTCPSGVTYGRLLDIGRAEVEKHKLRPLFERAQRKLLLETLSRPKRFAFLLKTGQWLRPLLPASIAQSIPRRAKPKSINWQSHSRKMLILEGCVQPSLAPQINEATRQVLNHIKIELLAIRGVECCGAMAHHIQAEGDAFRIMKKNIDIWHQALEEGAEALIITASGCATHIKEYGHLLSDDPVYAEKAARVSAAARDLVEVLEDENLSEWHDTQDASIAFHAPCTLQHGQGLGGRVEALLTRMGFKLTHVPDSHICCGSAGTYSILQKRLSQQLRANKLTNLRSGDPTLIATANIGCLQHLQEPEEAPVVHWIELLAKHLDNKQD